MEDNGDKANKQADGTSTPSPILLRRRLSAPETIMRKHALAQERRDSQERDTNRPLDARQCRFHYDIAAGSDPNLSKKRDIDTFRKSTLLRRLWGKTKPLIGSRFCEWKHSGKHFHSLNSSSCSLERLVKSTSRMSLNESPQHTRKVSRSQQLPLTTVATTAVTNSTLSSSSVTSTQKATSTSLIKSTLNSTKVNDCKDHQSTKIDSTNNNPSIYETKDKIKETPNKIDNPNVVVTKPSTLSESTNSTAKKESDLVTTENYIRYVTNCNESMLQESETTKMNVISNVQLSQTTLDLIFSQVMRDVQNHLPRTLNINTITGTIANQSYNKQDESLSEISGQYASKDDDYGLHSENTKSIKGISNIGFGSPYSLPTDSPQVVVTRYSALPATSSMEVNASSEEAGIDRESDNISPVDSLEDNILTSFRSESCKECEENMEKDEKIYGKKQKKPAAKPTAFYIPIIELDKQTDPKPVADLLPDKLKDRLAKRQQDREEKQLENRSKFSYTNESIKSFRSPAKGKKRKKPLLPRIESVRKLKVSSQANLNSGRHSSRSSKSDMGNHPITKKQTSLTSKTKHTVSNRLAPIYTTKNKFIYDETPRRIYHKTEFNESEKRIEILEIMECVDSPDASSQSSSRSRSKIPVLVPQHKLPKLHNQCNKTNKPVFLDFDQNPAFDPKLDQLVANILISTLNSNNDMSSPLPSLMVNDQPTRRKSSKNNSESISHAHRYSPKTHERIFEIIPEEISQQSSNNNIIMNENKSNENSITENNNEQSIETVIETIITDTNTPCNKEENANGEKLVSNNEGTYKGKAAVAGVKDEDLSSIPKGWITFYMLRKSCESPCSTSDEEDGDGKRQEARKPKGKEKKTRSGSTKKKKKDASNLEVPVCKTVRTLQHSQDYCPQDEFVPSENIVQDETLLPSSTNRNSYFMANDYNSEDIKYQEQHKWSVTVTGTTTSKEYLPNIEMRMKFPNIHRNDAASSASSGAGEQRVSGRGRRLHLPRIENRSLR